MQMPRPIKIWDIGIRLFHWSLVLLIPLLWLLAEQGEEIADRASNQGIYIDTMLWHARLGYAVLGLLVFRLLWGFVGSETARFTQFLRGPQVVLDYFRKQLNPSAADTPNVGHNPAGGWMVLVMLLLLIAQTVSGLFNFDDVDFEGPLYALVSETISDAMHDWHELNFDLMLIAIALHIGAIAFYAIIKKEQLVPPMIHGSRTLAIDHAPLMRGGWRLLCCALVGAAVSWWFWSF